MAGRGQGGQGGPGIGRRAIGLVLVEGAGAAQLFAAPLAWLALFLSTIIGR